MTTRHSRPILRALRDIIWSASGQIVVALCAFSSLRLFTELMSKAEFGRAMVAAGALALLDGVLVMALNQSLLPLCAARWADAGAPAADRLAAQLAFYLWRRVARALIVLAIAAAPIALVLGDQLWLTPAFALIYLGEAFVKTAQTSPLAARRAYAALAIWGSCEAIVTLAATTALLRFLRADATHYLVGLLLSRLLVTGAITTLRGAWSIAPTARTAPPSAAVTALWAQGLPLSALAPLGWIACFLDRYAVATAAGVGAAGVYVAVSGLATRPYATLTAILTQFFRPRLYDDKSSSSSTLALWLGTATLIGLLGAAAVSWLGRGVISLALAPDFRVGAKPILIVLCLAQSCAIACHALDNALIAQRASATLLGGQTAGVVAMVIFTPLGALHGGGFGAALGRLAAEAFKLIALAWLFARRRAQRKSTTEALLSIQGAAS